MVLEDSTERAAHRMCDLLKSLAQSVIITPEQMAQVSSLIQQHKNRYIKH